jgi:hypothetical protein
MATQPPEADELLRRLRRLWKGTLYVGVLVCWLLVLAGALVLGGWKALVAAFCVAGIGQFFRYLANDVDRIGWAMSLRAPAGGAEPASRFRKRIGRILFLLLQCTNAALAALAYALGGWAWAAAAAGVLLVAELLYGRIRSVNRQVQFERASYGFRDREPLADGADLLDPADYGERPRAPSLEEKLATLKEMAERGEISQSAYENVRDAKLVARVMGEPPFGPPW